MIINCPECNQTVSDKAISCPHCGYPIVDNSKSYPQKPTGKKSKKKKRLPNGFGQITKIRGNLRNPYRAMVTVGKTKEGKPICKLLKPQSYFKTYNDAYAALVEYNKSPYDLSPSITCNELYEKWIVDYEKSKSDSAIGNMRSTWKHCAELYDTPVNTIRIRHIKELLDGKKPGVKKRIKILWNLLLDYAVEYEIIDKNYSRLFKTNEKLVIEKSHIIFTDDEINILWENKENKIASMVLIQCYMGWRPQELCELLVDDVDLKSNTITGGMKTTAGKKRRVYVLPVIQPLVQNWYNLAVSTNSKYLFTTASGDKYGYASYRWKFTQLMNTLELSSGHRPHDPRKQFITMAKKANINEYAIKKLVGHEIADITEKIYTDRDPEWLKHEILKIDECMNSV